MKNNKETNEFDVYENDDLRNNIVEEDAFLTKLVDTIPPQMYFDQDIQVKLANKKHLFMNNKEKGFKRHFHELSAKNKHKRARLDPSCQKTISQINQESETTKKKNKKLQNITSPTLVRANNIEELQKRLKERISNLQAKRKGNDKDKKEKRSLKKKLQKAKLKRKGNLTKSSNFNERLESIPMKGESKDISKPIFNKTGKVIYSKFDFSENGVSEANNHAFKRKNYKKIMHNIEKKQEKIENFKKTDKEKANALIEKEMWKNAIDKSQGIKIKSDPKLLQKTFKIQKKKKEKSAKIWKSRIQQSQKRQKMRQEKRLKNIKNKKKEKLDKKIKKAKKKGRVIPGF